MKGAENKTMFVVLGGTGRVGSAVARALLDMGCGVAVVTRRAENARRLASMGAEVAVADVHDVDRLHDVFRRGRRLFLLNPPADPSTDAEATERATIRCILDALEGLDLEAIVAQSTYGARPETGYGDLSTLFALEEGLRSQPVPAAVVRGAFYMSNWDGLIDAAREGQLPTMFPADLEIPMVAPSDLGKLAASLLTRERPSREIHYMEGPARYSPKDVAAAFSSALGRPVDVVVTPRERWEQELRELGFSPAAARSYARMFGVTVDRSYEMPEAPHRGSTTLQHYIEQLVHNADG